MAGLGHYLSEIAAGTLLERVRSFIVEKKRLPSETDLLTLLERIEIPEVDTRDALGVVPLLRLIDRQCPPIPEPLD